jgi:putative hemolysin
MNPRLQRIPGLQFFRKKFVRLEWMPESFTEAPLFRMLTPPSSSPRESHEIFMQLLARHEPVIRGYLRLGAKVLGAPAWDPDFNSADLPMMMRIADLPPRYLKHFTAQPSRKPVVV